MMKPRDWWNRRLPASVRALSDACAFPSGHSDRNFVAPIIPGLNEEAIPEILSRARQAGTTSATGSLLRLPGHVEQVFVERMREAFPDRVSKMHRIRRFVGSLERRGIFQPASWHGDHWRCVEQLFELGRRRAGFEPDELPVPQTFRRPTAQQSLFDEEESL